MEANYGDTVKFQCLSSTPIRWELQDGVIGKNAELNTRQGNIHELIIYNLKRENVGQYKCYSEYEDAIYVGIGKLVIRGISLT